MPAQVLESFKLCTSIIPVNSFKYEFIHFVFKVKLDVMGFRSLSGHEGFTGKGRIIQARYHHTWQISMKAEKAVLSVLFIFK